MTIKEMNETRWCQIPFDSGRPSPTMTNCQWQERFQLMRACTPPSSFHKMRKGPWDSAPKGEGYNGETQYKYYASTINDILEQIRLGHREYCYYCYQIQDLLRFEHDRLCTKYIPQEEYWEVWLEGGYCHE